MPKAAKRPPGHVDVDRVPAPAFCLSDEAPPFASGWHAHRKHQLLYASAGTLRLEVEDRQWLLPPQRAAFIRSGVAHRVRSEQVTSLRTIYFAPRAIPFDVASPCAVFAIDALARELVAYSARWGPSRSPSDPTANAVFRAVVALLPEWISNGLALSLPRPRHPELERACDAVLARLDRPVGIADAARAAGVSPRTLARRFEDELQLGFREFLRRARLLRAMELLAAPGARIGQVAQACGFDSLAAFSRAFLDLTGERPKEFRARCSGPSGPLA
jgi:AraC-like DNA-binding protein/mannose-6-phosphate isomerase-like protein (cupin superfamily)